MHPYTSLNHTAKHRFGYPNLTDRIRLGHSLVDRHFDLNQRYASTYRLALFETHLPSSASQPLGWTASLQENQPITATVLQS